MDSDPQARSRQTVTAFFESQGEADHAKADLLAAGFAEADIHVVAGEAVQGHAAPHRDVGLFRALLDIFVFMPEDDKATYQEGLNRGGVALAVHTGEAGYERAIDILDRDGAVNLDERETEWKAGGWSRPLAAEARRDPADAADADSAQRHDPLVDAGAVRDVRERIGVGTANPSAGIDLAPESAVSPGPERTPIPGEEEASLTSRRDTGHGRARVRSYIGSVGGMPTGIDPAI
ncbi:hypothetical protein D3273_04555 [Lichenibacterium minor]|jgi:hypothetical protein|uniref:General stress protein 17M-like domain-containing protein n=1 Tax=Lichenibacterium minor TaxID=2316528 RepID=A0A4Q2UD76_9HYPH|nr:hypothetical protein [Lichenibacterium minor]RYC33147.1 hypothetical protein D3273_04555 [Lichenibacterium minor]